MALVSPSLLHYILKSFFDFHIVCAELVLTGFVDRWLSPPLGAVKLNVDGCLFGDDITLVEIAAKSGLSYPDSMASVCHRANGSICLVADFCNSWASKACLVAQRNNLQIVAFPPTVVAQLLRFRRHWDILRNRYKQTNSYHLVRVDALGNCAALDGDDVQRCNLHSASLHHRTCYHWPVSLSCFEVDSR
ncbi:hypothetical protein Ahy_A07g033941 isoform A [Arachis hypogaea]|uniref:Uncharacterized protein n=1 Tax=Arachis hypogaea TaxID=3818 RepID=A0A445CAI7_ARAHY|nr:hypothetical protein Ahy_A07g033941 isoform A [Arachis hypogaea]